jgi:3-hydroxyacyl-CoA dehydrogenase/enoyl-CoA hydratase/3-hydroxybutyryl-CoA epimerase
MAIYQCDTLTVERDRDGSVCLRIDVPGKSINVIDKQVLIDLDVALDHVLAEGRVPVLIIQSGKSTGFVAGADVSKFTSIGSVAEAEQMSAAGQMIFDKLARMPMPTIAMVSGLCLGGGLELAMACDYRIVYDRPSTQLGLPEIRLGILPAWGGTQRLPRVIGLERALQVILQGKQLDAGKALAWGLSDACPANEEQLIEVRKKVIGIALRDGKVSRDRLPLRTVRQRLIEGNPIGRRMIFRISERVLQKTVWEDMPGPAEALEVIRTGIQQGMEAGLRAEREAIGRLAVTPACRNLVGVFLGREQARKVPAGEDARAEVRRVGVVGAGVMGAGIAQLAALKGCQVVVQEVNEAALGAGMARIADLFGKAAGRGVVTPAEADRSRAAIKGTVAWDGFGDVDVVVEAAIEEMGAKKAIFRELENRTRPGAILATNTSSLPVAALQEGLNQPGRVAGLHFFNPVHRMELVEVAKTPATDEVATSLLRRWSVALGKTPVVVKDSPGFVVNRVLMPYLNEAVILVAEGMKIADLDRTMKRFGMPMGPLELIDQVGIDIAAHVAASVGPVMEGRFPPNDAFGKMWDKGWLGSKTKIGFYSYQGQKPKVNAQAEELLRSPTPGGSAVERALPPAARQHEARERMVLLMVNEAALALGEGLTEDAGSFDLAMVYGTGWAPHRGGPLHYADDRGLQAVVDRLRELAGRYGKRFEPCAELARRAASNERFTRPVGVPA